MSRRHLIMLLALAAIWGASFLFIEIALRELAPETVILFRIGSGALALGIYVALRGHGFGGLRPYLLPLALMGFNTALPFFLITWGQQYINSGLASIFNASAPIFTAVFALGVDHTQRATGLRHVGISLGFVGIVALVGFEPNGGARTVWGSLAVIGAAICYAVAALYAGRRPAARARRPRQPRLGDGLRAAARGCDRERIRLGDTRLGALPRRRSNRGRISPPFRADRGCGRLAGDPRHLPRAPLALVYGAVLLEEHISALALIGLALVL